MFDAVLVANRGEIAVRVIRACKEVEVRAVAVYSDADRDALHVRLADEAYRIGPSEPAQSYLNVDAILDAARQAGVDAIHPGYGFLSENADFAAAVRDTDLTFVGPPAEAIRRMGNKLAARETALAADAPVVPGTTEPLGDPDEARAFAEEHDFPVTIKAAFGGGGRGMRVVTDADELAATMEAAARESAAAFGREEVYLERYLPRPRHVEIQLLGDQDGTIVHLGERDCSLQRRYQKLIEEAPAPRLSEEVRDRMADAAVRIATEVGYTNAGTCEFLLDEDGTTFYFLEMNTRLQVEHPVTELVTGVDLVQAQLRVAAGDGIGFGQKDVTFGGHAIEVRLNSEDPTADFRPCPGRVTGLRWPDGPGVRVDGGVSAGGEIPGAYDSMLGKLIVWGQDRDTARRRMRRALDELQVDGLPTTACFHRMAMAHPDFVAGRHATTSVEQEWDLSALETDVVDAPAQQTPQQQPSRRITVEVSGRRFDVRVFGEPAAGEPSPDDTRSAPRRRDRGSDQQASPAGEDLVAPMQGTLIKYAVAEGDEVAEGDLVAVLEAMKMENQVTAHRAGTVSVLCCETGIQVESGATLAKITA